MVGTAATPATMLFLATVWGWRGAMIGAAALGYAVALVLLVQRRAFTARAASRPRRNAEKVGWNLLLSPPILRNVLFFALLAAAGSGISNFSIVALGALQGTRARGREFCAVVVPGDERGWRAGRRLHRLAYAAP